MRYHVLRARAKAMVLAGCSASEIPNWDIMKKILSGDPKLKAVIENMPTEDKVIEKEEDGYI